MLSYPLTGSEGHDAPFKQVIPETTFPLLSTEQQAVAADTAARQAEARSNPYLNGQDSKARLAQAGPGPERPRGMQADRESKDFYAADQRRASGGGVK